MVKVSDVGVGVIDQLLFSSYRKMYGAAEAGGHRYGLPGFDYQPELVSDQPGGGWQ